MNNTNTTKDYTENIVDQVEESAKKNNTSIVDNSEELQLLDVDDIEEELQVEDYTDAIDANVFLSKLL